MASPALLVVVNKIDRVDGNTVLAHLAAVAEVVRGARRRGRGRPPPVEYFPVSAVTGEGVDTLVDAVLARLPEGPRYYPEGMVTDVAEAFWVADLVREQLLRRVERRAPAQHRLPGHRVGVARGCAARSWSSATRRRASSSARAGATLKEVGTAVRAQMPPGAYLELFVRVEKHWQQRDDALDRLGF